MLTRSRRSKECRPHPPLEPTRSEGAVPGARSSGWGRPRSHSNKEPARRAAGRSAAARTGDALEARIRSGDDSARDDLVLANLGLAVQIARGFRSAGMSAEDLIQEANLGLVRAAAGYDPGAHDCRFSTYAAYWIKKYIHRALAANSSLVRIPNYLYVLKNKVRRMESDARNLDAPGGGAGRATPAAADLIAALGLDARWASHLARASIRSVSSGEDLNGDRVGLDELVAGGDSPDHEVEFAEEIAALHAALDCLTPFEAWLIRCRYGMADEHDLRRASRTSPRDEAGAAGRKSYTWISRACGLNVRRVRRVEGLAIRKLQVFLEL